MRVNLEMTHYDHRGEELIVEGDVTVYKEHTSTQLGTRVQKVLRADKIEAYKFIDGSWVLIELEKNEVERIREAFIKNACEELNIEYSEG